MISTTFGMVAFLNPWVLGGLIFLPALWFLLRITPPAPRLIRFPATRFLAGLMPEDQTTSRTPWWILLLRLFICALIILALAHPLLNPSSALPGSGPIRLVMDNGWSAAQSWEQQTEKALELIDKAGREERPVYILTTAPQPGKAEPLYSPPMTSAEAENFVKGLTPRPWFADYEQAQKLITDTPLEKNAVSFWLTTGLQDSDTVALVRTLESQGGLHVFLPDSEQLPVVPRLSRKTGAEIHVVLDASPTMPERMPVSIQSMGRDGYVLDNKDVILKREDLPAIFNLDLPAPIREKITQIRIRRQKGAGSIIVLDDSFKRRLVGVATPVSEDNAIPLIDESYYLLRALEPFADIEKGSPADLIAKNPAVIILSDIGGLPPADLNALEKWVEQGGLLLRFAGPRMTQGENFLTPVPLRMNGRALQGALTWENPAKIAAFKESSPYYGLSIPEDVTVKQQILAEPVPGIEDMTWAALEDGTPLITAKEQGKGMLVFVHTTATPQWSDLALSGLFVELLKRTVNLAGQSVTTSHITGTLQPLLVLDGFGRFQQPPPSVKPIGSEAFDNTIPSSGTPPGLYGRAGMQKALNLTSHIDKLTPFATSGIATHPYASDRERDLMPGLLLSAFGLYLLDWIVMIAMQLFTGRLGFRRARTALVLAACWLALSYTSSPARAETTEDMIRYASELHLAFVRTGISDIDYTSHQGLEALAETLTRRTSVEPAGVVALDPEKDELAFFPIIYWPVTVDQPAPSNKALQNIQNYLDQGGTIIFDTRDQPSSTSMSGGRNAKALQRIAGSLNIPPLTSMPADHVLTRSFYLLDDLPGKYTGGTIWVAQENTDHRDGVSPVIIGAHDWAAAWASANDYAGGIHLQGGSRQQEMALRAGVNMVMYALTGNYKADQVHVPHILERLGQ